MQHNDLCLISKLLTMCVVFWLRRWCSSQLIWKLTQRLRRKSAATKAAVGFSYEDSDVVRGRTDGDGESESESDEEDDDGMEDIGETLESFALESIPSERSIIDEGYRWERVYNSSQFSKYGPAFQIVIIKTWSWTCRAWMPSRRARLISSARLIN